MAQAIATGQDFNKRTEVFHAADRSVVDLADLDGCCASFDSFQRLLSQWPVGSGHRDTTILGYFDDSLSLFLDSADVLSTRTDQHADFVGLDLSNQQSRRVFGQLFAWSRDFGQHRAKDVDASFTRLSHRSFHHLKTDTANLQVQLDAGDTDLSSSDFEVHIAEVIFAAQNIGQQFVLVTFFD